MEVIVLKPEIKYEEDKGWEGTECEIYESAEDCNFGFVLRFPDGSEYHYFEDAKGSRFVKLTAEEVAEREAKRKAEIEEARKHPLRDKYRF